jgi:hypothetical protein
MIQRISKPVGTDFELRFAAIDSSGQPIVGSIPTFTIQSTSAASQRFNKYYDVAGNAWSTTPTNNAFAPIPYSTSMFMSNLDQSVIAPESESYLVTMSSNTTPNVVVIELWEFGGYESTWLEQLHQYMLAPRREISRFNGDNGIQERCYDSKTGGKEIIRVTSVQDPSGAQPEEIRTNDTDLISG